MTGSTSLPDTEEKARLILGAPLGRELISEFLGFSFKQRLFDTFGLGQVPGTATFTSEKPVRRRRRPTPNRQSSSGEWTELSVDDVRHAVATVVAEEEWRQLSELDELDQLSELAATSSSFGFSGGDYELWALTALATEELLPVARALVNSAATARWWEPIRRVDQRLLAWDDDDAPLPTGSELEHEVRESMGEERARNTESLRMRRPKVRPGIRMGATWWSSPSFAPNNWTTGAFDTIPTISLRHFIDTYTPFEETAATVWSLDIAPDARVLEIVRPSDWRDLVERHPRDVTGTHDGEWRDWGGVPGPWCLPDWEHVMDDFDGVHVTIGAYVASCGLALPVGDSFTMLSGWIPDATLWLHDVTTDRRRLGRWQGHPQGINGWVDVLEYWTPE